MQQEALRQEDQLKVIRALEPDYECASKRPGGRKGPAQDFTELCGLGRGKEKGETCWAVGTKRTGNERAVLGPFNGIFRDPNISSFLQYSKVANMWGSENTKTARCSK